MRFIESSCFFIVCVAVHGATHVVGSSTRTVYSMVSASRRVQRSVRCRFSCAPLKLDFGEKLVTSTTSVLPSHLARESPHHWRTVAGAWGALVMGTVRCQPWPCP